MSNVNPNHYKVAGRERQGEGILQDRHRQRFADNQARERFESRQGPPAATAPTPADSVTTTPDANAEEDTSRTTPAVRVRSTERRRPAKAAKGGAKKAVKKAVKKGVRKGVKKAPPASARKAARKTTKRTAKSSATSAATRRASAAGSRGKRTKTSAPAKRAGRRKRSS